MFVKDVNHFSVENPTLYIIYDQKPYVNHFSVENAVSPRKDVNHFSVENLCLLDNITYDGDRRLNNTSVNGVRTFFSLLKLIFSSKSKKPETCFPLIICVITTLLKLFVIAGMKVYLKL